MPAAESFCQSQRCPREYTFPGGLRVTERNGCLLLDDREVIADSDHAADTLLRKAQLTAGQRQWVEEWGRVLFPIAGMYGATAVRKYERRGKAE